MNRADLEPADRMHEGRCHRAPHHRTAVGGIEHFEGSTLEQSLAAHGPMPLSRHHHHLWHQAALFHIVAVYDTGAWQSGRHQLAATIGLSSGFTV